MFKHLQDGVAAVAVALALASATAVLELFEDGCLNNF